MAVTPDLIAVALKRPVPSMTSPEAKQWAMWIADARMLIANRLGELDDLDETKLDYVVREAVAARVEHPGRAEQVSVTLGQQTISRRYPPAVSSSGITILSEWWALLDPDTSDSGAFTVRPAAEPDTTEPTVWASGIAF